MVYVALQVLLCRGLLAITNEILLQSNEQSDICSKLQLNINQINQDLDSLEKEEYIANIKKKNLKVLPIDQNWKHNFVILNQNMKPLQKN